MRFNERIHFIKELLANYVQFDVSFVSLDYFSACSRGLKTSINDWDTTPMAVGLEASEILISVN